MFRLLTECLTPEQQASLLAQSLVRGTKGLEASNPFYTLPLETILTSAKAVVMNLTNSYAAKRSGIPNATIWCDRFAELAIFLKGLVGNPAMESKLLKRYPLISQSELQEQTGGIPYGYWKLAGLIEEHQGINEQSLDELINLVRKLISLSPQTETQNTFTEELANYTNAKSGRKRTAICSLSGEVAFPIKSAGMPYKTQIYGNKRGLGTFDQFTFCSPQWQRELALRLVLFGKDKNQGKWWVYASQNIKNIDGIEVPMDYLPPQQAIAKGLELVAKDPAESKSGVGFQYLKPAERSRVLVSPSVVPDGIQQDYCIQCPPFWMQILNLPESGTAEDAWRVSKILKMLIAMNIACKTSIDNHASKCATDILHIPHVLNGKVSLETINSYLTLLR